MPDWVCMVQEGQVADRQRDALAARLAALGRAAFGDADGDPDIRWVVYAPGYAFTAGAPSTSSIVVRSVPPGLADDRREAFLRDVCALWQDVTRCSIDEIVVTAWDGPLPL